MKQYLDKFNELCKGKTTLNIQLLKENTFSIRRIRYNQSGAVCYCMDGEDIGKIKEKNLWKEQSCDSSCSYLQKDKNGKSACNRMAWLKFFIPEITTDRIWLMRITGQQSIDNIDGYLQLQELQGNSLNNLFTLFLKQEQQIDCFGKIHKNYVLDIIKKDDFVSKSQIPQSNEEQKDFSTENTQNVNNNVEQEQQNTVTKPVNTQKNNVGTKNAENITPKEETKQNTTNINENNKTEKSEQQTKNVNEKSKENTESKKTTTENYDNYYVFESLSSEKINTKSGTKDYTIGKFYDTSDKPQNIIINPQYVAELENCELGTIVSFTELKEIYGRKFAVGLNFIQKMEKDIAA